MQNIAEAQRLTAVLVTVTFAQQTCSVISWEQKQLVVSVTVRLCYSTLGETNKNEAIIDLVNFVRCFRPQLSRPKEESMERTHLCCQSTFESSTLEGLFLRMGHDRGFETVNTCKAS
jgi:hypothetical protein